MELEIIKSKINPFYWSMLKDTDIRLDVEMYINHAPSKLALDCYLDNLFYIYHTN